MSIFKFYMTMYSIICISITIQTWLSAEQVSYIMLTPAPISLTTEAFLAALRCLSAHLGRPTIHSDNGINQRGASIQTQHVYTMLQSSTQMARIQDFLSKEGCEVPPMTSHTQFPV
jgi:hypothetical protein